MKNQLSKNLLLNDLQLNSWWVRSLMLRLSATLIFTILTWNLVITDWSPFSASWESSLVAFLLYSSAHTKNLNTCKSILSKKLNFKLSKTKTSNSKNYRIRKETLKLEREERGKLKLIIYRLVTWWEKWCSNQITISILMHNHNRGLVIHLISTWWTSNTTEATDLLIIQATLVDILEAWLAQTWAS